MGALFPLILEKVRWTEQSSFLMLLEDCSEGQRALDSLEQAIKKLVAQSDIFLLLELTILN